MLSWRHGEGGPAWVGIPWARMPATRSFRHAMPSMTTVVTAGRRALTCLGSSAASARWWWWVAGVMSPLSVVSLVSLVSLVSVVSVVSPQCGFAAADGTGEEQQLAPG